MNRATYETVHNLLAQSDRPSSEVVRYFVDSAISTEIGIVMKTCKSLDISPAVFIEGMTRYLVACIVGTAAPFISTPKGLMELERAITSELRIATIHATSVMMEKQNAANS